MAIFQDIISTTPEKYIFKLVSDTETIICNPPPIEWRSGTLEMKRDLNVGGVFSTFQLESLTFVGNGAKLLRSLFEAFELNAKCTLIVLWWKGSTRSYVEFPSRFDINFNFYEIVKVGRFAFGVRVKAINSSTQTKLDNRQEINVDLTKLVSIGGVEIKDYPSLKKGLQYRETNINYHAEMKQSNPKGWDMAHKSGENSYSSIPLNKIGSDFTEVQEVGYITKSKSLQFIPSFFNTAKYDYEFEISYKLLFHVYIRHVGSFPWNVRIIETGANGSIINTTDLGGFGGQIQDYTLSDTVFVSVSKGNSLKLVCEVAGIQNTLAYLFASEIKINQVVAQSPATLTEGFPVYEAIERTCQHILDVQYPFYSEFFGRTDTPYNQTGVKYSTENQLRFAHIQSGLNQRGVKLNDPNATLALNFKDLFATLKAIYNVGYSLETNISLFGDLLQRIRIEQYSYFFQDTQVLDLSSRIGKYDIQSQVMPELVPVNLKSGFDNYEYLSLNGRAEPNTTNERTTVMNTASKFEIISPYRGDTKGILDNLSNPITSEDKKGDSDIFIVKSQRGALNFKTDKIIIDNYTGDRLISCNGYSETMTWEGNEALSIGKFINTYRNSFGNIILGTTLFNELTFTATTPGTDFANATINVGGTASVIVPATGNQSDWKPERSENITIEDGTSLFKEDLFNRYFTPSRMLKRHGNRIKSGLTKYLSSVLRFQTSDKSSSLKTTGEGYTITESDDINVSDLDAPIYKPIKHTAIVPFYLSDLESLQTGKFGYIRFSDNLTGYLLSLKKKNAEDKAEISIIERYIP